MLWCPLGLHLPSCANDACLAYFSNAQKYWVSGAKIFGKISKQVARFISLPPTLILSKNSKNWYTALQFHNLTNDLWICWLSLPNSSHNQKQIQKTIWWWEEFACQKAWQRLRDVYSPIAIIRKHRIKSLVVIVWSTGVCIIFSPWAYSHVSIWYSNSLSLFVSPAFYSNYCQL